MINYLSLFSGIGSPEKALENLGIPFNLVNYCEIDKYASKSFSAIHNVSEDLNLWDVTKINADTISERIDLITYGFPCQDISVAGKQRGFTDEEGNRTRSGLFFEALRIIQDYQPKFAIAENVKALTSKKFEKEFNTVLTSLEEAGYNNYWKVLNAKDYGIPQNRERVFIVSIRKDIDKGFDFPEPIELKLRLKDMLDKDVDEKYYLSDEQVEKMTLTTFNTANINRRCNEQDSIVNTLMARDYKDPKCVRIGIDKSSNNPHKIEIANCITAREDRGISRHKAEDTAVTEIEYSVPKVKVKVKPVLVRKTAKKADPFIVASRGRNPVNPSDRTAGIHTKQRLEPNMSGCSNTITTVQKDNYVCEPEIIVKGNIYPNSGNPQAGRIYDSEGISPSLDTCQGWNRMPKIISMEENGTGGYKVIVKEATKKGYTEALPGDSINLEQPNSQTRRGRVGHGVAQTLTTSCNQAVVE